MGDYARSQDYTGDEVVKFVINEVDWSNHPGDAEADYEGEYNYEDGDGPRIEGEYHDEDSGLNVEFSYTYDSSQQLGGTAAVYTYDSGQPVASGHPRHRRRHSTSAVHKLVEEPGSPQSSSEEDEVKVKPKTKKKSHFHHLAEPPQDDTYSDPGCGESERGYREVGRSQSINAVASWLHDAHLGEHSETIPPRRRAPGVVILHRPLMLLNIMQVQATMKQNTIGRPLILLIIMQVQATMKHYTMTRRPVIPLDIDVVTSGTLNTKIITTGIRRSMSTVHL